MMGRLFIHSFITFFQLSLLVFLTGCGNSPLVDSISPSSPTTPTPTLTPTATPTTVPTPATNVTKTINGKVQLGPVNHAAIEAFCMSSDPSIPGTSLGTTTSNANGEFRLEVSAVPQCQVVLKAKGGDYKEESSGGNISLSSTQEVKSVLGDISSETTIDASITPLSHLVSARVDSMRTNIGPTSDADVDKIVKHAKEEVALAAGFSSGDDITKTIPASPDLPTANIDSKENRLALVLAGISAIGQNNSANSYQIATTIAGDFDDGIIDSPDWKNLNSHISNWVNGAQNTGGVQLPTHPIIPSSMPEIDSSLFLLPTPTVPPPYERDAQYFTKPAHIGLNPEPSYTTGINSPCTGPYKVNLYDRHLNSAVFDVDKELHIEISNSSLVSGANFSLHANQTDCVANQNTISKITILKNTSSADIWIRSESRNFGYPVDVVAFDPNGLISPNFIMTLPGTSSTGPAVANKTALRWNYFENLISNSCFGPFSLENINSTGKATAISDANLNIDISKSFSRGTPESTGFLKFYSDSACSNSISSINIPTGSSVTNSFYASIPAAVNLVNLVATSDSVNVLSHTVGGLSVHGLESHIVVPTATPSPVLVTNVSRLRLFNQYSGAAGVQETIDFSANTLVRITSASTTLITCNLDAAKIAELKAFIMTNGICNYGADHGGCQYGREMALDIIANLTSMSVNLSGYESCRYPTGIRQITDFCNQKRPQGLKLIRDVYATRTNCH